MSRSVSSFNAFAVLGVPLVAERDHRVDAVVAAVELDHDEDPPRPAPASSPGSELGEKAGDRRGERDQRERSQEVAA